MATARTAAKKVAKKHSPEHLQKQEAEQHSSKGQGHAIHMTMHWIDPASLPETSGTLSKFLHNLHGDVDGFLLDGRQQVHFPPHMSKELQSHIKLGEKVRVHGVRPRGVDLLVAASVTSAKGRAVIDHGPGKKH